MKKGKFYGVSVGPGDPELLTLKAVRILEGCPVIAAPQTRGGNTLALDIVKEIIDLSEKNILPLTFLMTSDEAARCESHQREALRIMTLLDQGLDVAMVNIGDISIYSTFGYMRDIIRGSGYLTEAVPGVPSFCAAAAVLGTSLTTMKKPLHIIPAGYGDFEEHLGLDGTKVIMKAGSALPEVKRILCQKGLTDKASLAANCGLPNQRVYQSIEDACDIEGYFATILMKE